MAKLYGVDCGQCKFSICNYNGLNLDADSFYEGHDPAKMTEHMESIKEMEIRDDDVFLLTYPRSGTHLVREICHMLQVGRIEYISEDNAFSVEYRNISELSSLKSPRNFHIHLWYHMLPRSIQEGKQGKAIAVFRNPKDAIVSFWHFMSSRFQATLPIDIFTKLQITDKLLYNSWYKWRQYLLQGKQKHNNFNILSVKYEDLLQNPKQEISRIAKYLGKDVSGNFIDEIRKACDISTMRKEKAKCVPKDVGNYFREGYDPYYRKGSLGDWKTDLPPDVNAILDEWIASQDDDNSDEFPNYKNYYKEI